MEEGAVVPVQAIRTYGEQRHSSTHS